MNIWKKVFNIIKSITKKDAVYIVIILLLVSFLCSSIKQCSDTRFNYKNNIEVLNDTIRYYKDKNGNILVEAITDENGIFEILTNPPPPRLLSLTNPRSTVKRVSKT